MEGSRTATWKRRARPRPGGRTKPDYLTCEIWPQPRLAREGTTRVRRFRKKKFSLQSETRSVSHAHAKKMFRFLLLLFASDQSEINRAYFRFVSLPKIFSFASFSFCFHLFFVFVSLQMRKKRKKHFFASKRKNFNSRFASFCFEAKIMAVFRFRFASFHFEAKMIAVFPSVSLLFASK